MKKNSKSCHYFAIHIFCLIFLFVFVNGNCDKNSSFQWQKTCERNLAANEDEEYVGPTSELLGQICDDILLT